MSKKFQDKYRVDTIRARWHSYKGGVYFVTICTQHRRHYFGEIYGEQMFLSDIGRIAEQCWIDIPHHFSNVDLGPYVVMPNHIHGVIALDLSMPTLISEEEPSYNQSMQQFGKQTNNLASVIRGFKIGVTKYAHQYNRPFEWQPRFYDRIIRDQREWDNVAEYIVGNVQSWCVDRLYTDD